MADSLLNWGRWPGKINDYLAAGKASAINDVGDVADLFREAEVGLFAPHDTEGFAATIGRLLDDRDLRERMGRNARRLMVERYDWEIVGQAAVKVVESIGGSA
ncbi:MAG: hypothetical protein A2Z34_09595 [Planctomycetes bacterium RBG_16_59_8]|nr:MAG: hypothetical protein A2Z34_09595 [Planctomycetes bacterium RBG_16_59_8]